MQMLVPGPGAMWMDWIMAEQSRAEQSGAPWRSGAATVDAFAILLAQTICKSAKQIWQWVCGG